MIRPLSQLTTARQAGQMPARRGFTLVELLVVIGIIVLLIGLLLTAVTRARSSAEQTRVLADLQAISVALEAYRQTFGDYPRLAATETVNNPMDLFTPGNFATTRTGAELLAWALIGPYEQAPAGPNPQDAPGDGADGPGFRTSATGRGQVYGPFLAVDRFRTGVNAQSGRPFHVIYDYNDQPILYYAASPRTKQGAGPDIRSGTGLIDRIPTAKADSWYDARDNDIAFYRQQTLSDANEALYRIRVMLGDINANGRIDGDEIPRHVGKFLLYSAGADTKFGPDDPSSPSEVTNCDDVLLSTDN